MSNLLEQASLVMIPSGYKEDVVYSEIPLDGSGDMAFTRASNGTRINSQGLVEVAPWNLAQYSEELNNAVYVVKNAVTIVDNSTTAPNGTTTADLIYPSSSGNYRYVAQAFTQEENIYTLSVYAKAQNKNVIWMYIESSSATGIVYYDLSDGTMSVTAGSVSTPIGTMTAVGNGWYRCTYTLGASLSLASGSGCGVCDAKGSVYATASGTNGVYFWGYQLNIGSTAKPYFPTTDRLNVPRLTYQNGGCPSLLLEKQSTNFVKYSQDFTQSDWTQSGATITANAIISPDGTQNATRVQFSAGSRYVYQTIGGSGVTAGNVTISCWIKGASVQKIGLSDGNANPNEITLTTDWQRYTFTFSYSSGGIGVQFDNYFGVTPSAQTKDFYIWGAQAEQSSYATSYIPTTSTTATRVADECAKNGIGALIGGTSGTVFFDVTTNPVLSSANYKQFCYYFDSASAQSYMYLDGSNLLRTNANWGSLVSSTLQPNTRYKVALTYAPNDFALYINGVSVATASSGTPKDNVNISIGQITGTENCEFVFNQYTHFPSRLTNAELASLTTI